VLHITHLASVQGKLGSVNMDNIAAAARVATGDLTGTVIDAGEGVTHVVPIVNGYVVGAAIRSVPLAGGDITAYIQSSLRARGQPLPQDFSLDVCRSVPAT
jgi:actin-related protein 3